MFLENFFCCYILFGHAPTLYSWCIGLLAPSSTTGSLTNNFACSSFCWMTQSLSRVSYFCHAASFRRIPYGQCFLLSLVTVIWEGYERFLSLRNSECRQAPWLNWIKGWSPYNRSSDPHSWPFWAAPFLWVFPDWFQGQEAYEGIFQWCPTVIAPCLWFSIWSCLSSWHLNIYLIA